MRPPLPSVSPLRVATVSFAVFLLGATPLWASPETNGHPDWESLSDTAAPPGPRESTETEGRAPVPSGKEDAVAGSAGRAASDHPDLSETQGPVESAPEIPKRVESSASVEQPAPIQRRDTSHLRHELALAATQFSYFAFFRETQTHLAADLSISRVFHPFSSSDENGSAPRTGMPVILGGGLRWAPGPSRGLPFELYASVRLRARLGPWEPMAGPELGYSGFTRLVSDRDYRPPDLFDIEQRRVSPLYLTFGMAPLRFVVNRLTISVAELQVGATLSPPGGARRFQMGLLRLGWRL